MVSLEELRALAERTTEGHFRPLFSTPNLQSGWVWVGNDESCLERVLQIFYPGALADWWYARRGSWPIANYRDFTRRQTGMYRITALLSDDEVREVFGACCSPAFCLKRRIWGVENQEPQLDGTKSVIPCFEPCAILLELSRKAARLSQDNIALKLSREEIAALIDWAEKPPAQRDEEFKEADFSDSNNPRRKALLLEKLRRALKEQPRLTEKKHEH
jgi:hypothetical protein